MSVARRVGPFLEQAITVLLNRADRRDTVSIKAALREARETAPYLVASDEELTEAIVEAATALGLCVAFDAQE
ncbi:MULTISPECIES: hypothetical protein [unclassified Mesorhizobium]|uniref:hypothetical protein n=1 Tax=unclassified Mesorhizobium TaxID=325217 RepID=UPI003337F70B